MIDFTLFKQDTHTVAIRFVERLNSAYLVVVSMNRQRCHEVAELLVRRCLRLTLANFSYNEMPYSYVSCSRSHLGQKAWVDITARLEKPIYYGRNDHDFKIKCRNQKTDCERPKTTFTKLEQRPWTKIEVARGRSAQECFQGLREACGDAALPYRTVARWVKAFREGLVGSAVKVMFIVAYDIDGVILHHAVPPRQTENADYYCRFLQHHLRPALRRKRRHLGVQNPIILHDNAKTHTAAVVKDFLRRWQWEILEHPPYSPDMIHAITIF
ncbi:hypothetical protein ANN_20643 [Periplaneta americana]|uniref:Mos1 transposase HTH domain-containing protein n=1 Tax=Periplaneta americana TaxID=6978 RepID=A0ABQ8SD88_PERAM|nr:hypothetical protein ANN_20643 [Periplaneta americana]